MDLPTPRLRPAEPAGTAADASVRAARPGDADAIGRVQAAAWLAAYGELLPAAALDALDSAALAEAWRSAVTSPPSRAHAVLVAVAAGSVVGFAAVAPADPGADGEAVPVGELVALVVDPPAQHQGHGSRLLNAAAQSLRDSGLGQLLVWVPEADGPRLAFLQAAGLQPDGGRRTLHLSDDEEGRPGVLQEVRLAASLAGEA